MKSNYQPNHTEYLKLQTALEVDSLSGHGGRGGGILRDEVMGDQVG